MHEEAVRTALDAAMKDVLEQMFFIEASGGPCGEGDGNPGEGDAVEACLTFEGEPPGRFLLRVPAAAAQSIAADFLGADESGVSGQRVGEVVCELANMICGSALSRLESTATFRLGRPEIAPRAADLRAGTQFTRHSIETTRGVFTAALTMKAQACQLAEKPGC
jgi:CheY-specific phosphatase CheX